MREIAAASDFDFVALEPARPKKGKALQRAAAAPKKPSRLARLWRFRAPVFGGLAMTGLLGGILFNAMFLQHGRHPAPLLGGATLRIAPPSPPPRPAAYSPLLNDQIPRPVLNKVVASPDAAFAAPTAALDDEPAADAPPAEAPEVKAAPVPSPAVAAPHVARATAHVARSSAHVAAQTTHVLAHGAAHGTAHGATHGASLAAAGAIKSSPLPPAHGDKSSPTAKPSTQGAKTPAHAVHAAKKGPDPIAALLAGQAR